MPRRRSSFFYVHLDRHTAHGVVTVLIFAAAALLLLATFDLAGQLGITIDNSIAKAIGWQRLALPFFLFAIGIHEVAPERLPLKASNSVGFILFFFSLNPFVHTVGAAGSVVPSNLDMLGGKLGALVAEPFVSLVGRAGSITIFSALFLISLLLIFNSSFRRVVARAIQILRFFKLVFFYCSAPVRWFLAQRAERLEARLRAEALNPITPSVFDTEVLERAPLIQRDVQNTALLDASVSDQAASAQTDAAYVHIVPPKPRKRRPYIEIPIEFLTRRDQKPTSGDIAYNQQLIQRTLETFGISVEMGEVSVGPTVTQFTLKPADGVKLAKITALHNDLALALAAHPIRMEAPIPGKSLVGIEVPNQSVALVGIREILESREWRDGRRHGLPIAVGRDVSGRPWIADIERMPHLLVAGATGSGKSVCLNTLIMSMLYRYGPDALKFIFVDPKRVELQIYNGIPHLLTPVVTDTEATVNALKWALSEMERRFDLLSHIGARDVSAYNARCEDKLPLLVILIDELADLMVAAASDVEGPIVRLAQMARAVGIHLLLATQRPSVDVITGLIKANIPARASFAVASSTDSRTILDQAGAEKLLGRGDMLFQTSDMPSPKRIQGAFVSEEEISRVVEFLKSAYEPVAYDPCVIEKQGNGGTRFVGGSFGQDDADPLLPEAKEEILKAGKASASLLQRRLKIGYARAARILDLLEEEGFIGPADGAKPRDILNARLGRQQEPLMSGSGGFAPTHPALEQVNQEIPNLEDES